MEGYASVITGAHLFQRGSPRQHAGRSFRAFFSITGHDQLKYWASEADARAGAEPMGAVETADISGVRVATPRRAGADGEQQLQFELRLPDGKQRMIRIVPANAQQCQDWATKLAHITHRRHSAATSLAGAASRASEGYRNTTVEKQGLLFTPYLGSGTEDEPPWLAVKVRVERRGDRAEPSYVLRYGTAEAADVSGAGGSGLLNAETIGMKAVHSVRFGFGGPGARAATTDTLPGDKTLDRKSCHFQFSIADTTLDGPERVQQVARMAEAQSAASRWRQRQPPPSWQPHSPADRVLRLRTRTTRECIEWVHLLRKLSVDRLLYPELLPLGVQRLLRALFHRALHNADGSVKEAELGRQLQRDRVLREVLPEEFRAPISALTETEDVAMAAVEAAAVAAWLFDGEDAAREVLADAVASAAVAGGAAVDDAEEKCIQASVQASYSYERSMTLDTFVHEMNSRHYAALEAATAPYAIYTSPEALAKLCSDLDLPEHLDPAGAVWVAEEKLGLPHELPPTGPSVNLTHSLPVATAHMRSSSVADGHDHDHASIGAGTSSPSPDAVTPTLAAVDRAAAIDEALEMIFAHLGQRIVLVPVEDPSSSKAIAMEGLMRVLNADAVPAAKASGQNNSLQQLVDYATLDGGASGNQGQSAISPQVVKLHPATRATAGHASCDSEAADDLRSPGAGGSGWGPLKATGLRDRPYGSYRRCRRKALPSPQQQREEQVLQAAMMERQQERNGYGELGMVPSAVAQHPVESASHHARLAVGVRLLSHRSTSEMSESEELALALTPTDTYRHLSHAEQKRMRKKDFDDLIATAAAQAEEPTDDDAKPTQREAARREAEEKRRKNAQDLAQKRERAASATKALSASRFSPGVKSSGADVEGRRAAAGEEGAAATDWAQQKVATASAGDGDWSSRVGVGSSAAMVLAELGL